MRDWEIEDTISNTNYSYDQHTYRQGQSLILPQPLLHVLFLLLHALAPLQHHGMLSGKLLVRLVLRAEGLLLAAPPGERLFQTRLQVFRVVNLVCVVCK